MASNIDTNFLESCNTNFAYKELSKKENGAQLLRLYTDVKALLTMYYREEVDMKWHFKDPLRRKQCWHRDTVNFKQCGLTWGEATKAVYAVYSDCPIFYFVDKYKVGGSPHKGEITPVLDYEFRRGDFRKFCTERIEDEIIASARSIRAKNDREKAKAIYDLIKSEAEYDEIKGTTNYVDTPAHSVIGYVRNRAAVCEGFSETYQIFMNHLSVPTTSVSGMQFTDDRMEKISGAHARNLTYLSDEDKWIMVDVTTGVNGKNDLGFEIPLSSIRFRRFLESEKGSERERNLPQYDDIWRSYIDDNLN